MKEQLQNRLTQLKEEQKKGKAMMADLKQRKANLKESLLRIEGAIQVLEEELSKVNEN